MVLLTLPAASHLPAQQAPDAEPGPAITSPLDGRVVSVVRIEGLVAIDEAYVRNQMRTQQGQPYSQDQLQRDVGRLLRTGRFIDVHPETQVVDEQVQITLRLTEKPSVAAVEFVGNKKFKPKDLLEALAFAAGDPLDLYDVSRGREAIERLYREKGYAYVEVTFDEQLMRDEQRVVYTIVENQRVRVRKVRFEGNVTYSARELETQVETKPFLPIFRAGDFDPDRAERDAAKVQQYYRERGFLDARVSYVTEFEDVARERLALIFRVSEGVRYRIREIIIRGNEVFTTEQISEKLTLQVDDFLMDGRVKADVKTIETDYGAQGHIYAQAVPTWVFAEEPERVVLTLTIREGEQFRVSGFTFGGNLLGREAEFADLVQLKPGDVFSGSKLTASTDAIDERLGALGYAFGNVNAVPIIDREKREVEFQILVDPARRVYVRRINVTGNSRTRDEVIRRELRQFEDAWYDAEKIRLSRERIGRLGYFTDVRIDTQPIPDAPDQVDLNVVVEERPTGNITFGIGFSSTEKVILSAGLNQQNFMGTGKSLGIDINTSRLQRPIALAYTDPYFTPDGVSRSFDLYTRTFDASELDLGDYRIRSSGVGLRFGVPYTEHDRLSFGLVAERNELRLGELAPDRYVQQVEDFGESATALLAVLGWSRDSRDSAITPTRGRAQSANLEVAIPPAELRYWRANYNHQWYYPLNRDYTLALYGDVAYGRAYGDKPYPLFKNYFAGGIGSVRGFYPSSLGPKDTETLIRGGTREVPLGGQMRVIGSAEFIFPLPGTGNDRSCGSRSARGRVS